MVSSQTTKRYPLWSCLSLAHFFILAMGGHLMTVKSQLQLTRMFIFIFLTFLSGLDILFCTINGCYSCPFTRGKFEHERVHQGWVSWMLSCDCTHIITERCQYNLKNNHFGGKNALTTRTFNLTCNHHCHILHTTNRGPGRWDDQSMVRLDTFVSGICNGSVLDESNFKLLAHNNNGNEKNAFQRCIFDSG